MSQCEHECYDKFLDIYKRKYDKIIHPAIELMAKYLCSMYFKPGDIYLEIIDFLKKSRLNLAKHKLEALGYSITDDVIAELSFMIVETKSDEKLLTQFTEKFPLPKADKTHTI